MLLFLLIISLFLAKSEASAQVTSFVALFGAEVKRLPLKARFYPEVLREVELPNPLSCISCLDFRWEKTDNSLASPDQD